ncbi:hypothetical protein KFL_008720050, partial [Klebsormidium nitens]
PARSAHALPQPGPDQYQALPKAGLQQCAHLHPLPVVAVGAVNAPSTTTRAIGDATGALHQFSANVLAPRRASRSPPTPLPSLGLGGGARERVFHLESTMEVELSAANAPARAQFATRTRAWQLECTEKKWRSSETQRLKGVHGNMPLNFLPCDATSTARLRGGKDLEYDPFQVLADQAMQGQLQQAQATAAQAQQQAAAAAATQAQAVAAAAGRVKASPPSKWENEWPMIEERLKPAQSTKLVAGKRKASGSGSGMTSKARLSAVPFRTSSTLTTWRTACATTAGSHPIMQQTVLRSLSIAATMERKRRRVERIFRNARQCRTVV